MKKAISIIFIFTCVLISNTFAQTSTTAPAQPTTEPVDTTITVDDVANGLVDLEGKINSVGAGFGSRFVDIDGPAFRFLMRMSLVASGWSVQDAEAIVPIPTGKNGWKKNPLVRTESQRDSFLAMLAERVKAIKGTTTPPSTPTTEEEVDPAEYLGGVLKTTWKDIVPPLQVESYKEIEAKDGKKYTVKVSGEESGRDYLTRVGKLIGSTAKVTNSLYELWPKDEQCTNLLPIVSKADLDEAIKSLNLGANEGKKEVEGSPNVTTPEEARKIAAEEADKVRADLEPAIKTLAANQTILATNIDIIDVKVGETNAKVDNLGAAIAMLATNKKEDRGRASSLISLMGYTPDSQKKEYSMEILREGLKPLSPMPETSPAAKEEPKKDQPTTEK